MVWCTCQLIYLHILAILLFRDGRVQQATETEIQDRSRVVIQVGSELILSDINSVTHKRLGDDKTEVTFTFFFRQFFSNIRVEITLCSETRSEVNMMVQAGNTTCLPDPWPRFRTGREDRLRHSFVCLTNTTSVVLRCRGPLVIRYLRIFTSQVCPKHRYDPPGCRRPCSDRCQNRPCDQWSGACLPACPHGFHGYDCHRRCRCKDPLEACDDVTGYCRSGCTPGYDPATFCSELCKNLTWGPGCSRRCNCIFNTPCNPVSGVCPHGCQSGFQWFHGKCQMKCEEGRYGRDCRETCGFCLITCDGDTGDCVSGQCKAGYCGRRCDVKVTPSGCPKTCGRCFAQSCLAALEECTRGCQPGFYGVSCEAACPEVSKGLNCSQGCGRCPGTTRPRRQAQNTCPPNMWGEDCINKCSDLCQCGCSSVTGDCLENCPLTEALSPKETKQKEEVHWIWVLVILISLMTIVSALVYCCERRQLRNGHAETAQIIFNRMIQMPAPDSPSDSTFHVNAEHYSPRQRLRLTRCLAILVHKDETYEDFVQSKRFHLFRFLLNCCKHKRRSPDNVTVQFVEDHVSVSIPVADSDPEAGTAVDGVVDVRETTPGVHTGGILIKSSEVASSHHKRGLSVHFSPSVLRKEKSDD